MKLFQWLRKQRRSPRISRIDPQGEHHDLKEIYQQVNIRYFEGKLQLPISWVGNKESKPKTRIMFGSYNQRTQHIKIHRRLDQAHIPQQFIAFIIYHEMLHHVLPPVFSGKRRKIHHTAFKAREKLFDKYEQVIEFRDKIKQITLL